jgi:hypothetical protein
MTELESARIGVKAQIPIVRAMQRELGVERANELIAEALADEATRSIEKQLDGRKPSKMPYTEKGLAATFAAGGALEYRILREDDEAFEFDVTRCRYKQLMEELDAVDLGGLLLCNGDFPAAEAAGLELVRTQTCMQGASHCDFRYRMKRG